ncbi:DUF3549 family protein [Halioxenophilus sp. WMMB6]|uniref:DUF3549 family protein n=1 Tax=Halioxenophilus sp. WMMB6 TaxID=3073815 RepID=UPI00295EF01A|nr:DUF3549 family protein [Halioxenophilus sp. WMMB6]
MNKVEGITGFFKYLGAEARYFDLGRRIQNLPASQFTKADLLQTPYPHPYLRHAWLGVVFWSKQNQESPMVWSLKLPLDEQGFIAPAERDRFLQQLLLSIGSNIQRAQSGHELAAVLDNNPYAFTLPEDRQAAFHAKVSATLKRPPSRFYQPTLDYLAKPSDEGWQSLGIQGLADIAARWQEHQPLLQTALKTVPAPAFIGLAQLLEHEAIDVRLTQVLIDRLEAELGQSQPATNVIAAAIRGISHSQATGLRRQALVKAMAMMPEVDVEVVAAIASRCSDDLADVELGLQFLEMLAKLGHDNFIQVLADLMALPELRPHLMQALRHPNRSETLVEAIGALFKRLEEAGV